MEIPAFVEDWIEEREITADIIPFHPHNWVCTSTVSMRTVSPKNGMVDKVCHIVSN
jgi:hypothetical protein